MHWEKTGQGQQTSAVVRYQHFDEKKETWYFSVIDIVAALTEQPYFKKAKSYWTTLKNRLKNEGSELVTKCDKLKLQSADGKFYKYENKKLKAVMSPYQHTCSALLKKASREKLVFMNNLIKKLQYKRKSTA
ncbi:MAG: hypothetical protein KBD15_03470 [Candidatus Magasanikbacteria bacterium]|jgi:hypothetical protein|nr:hypothetical protein [Candidatus Magasanikbacteria bacterium]